MAKSHKLSSSIGHVINNINVQSCSSHDLVKLKDEIYQHKIVILKNQKMSAQEFCDFSKTLGEPIPYLQDNYHHPDYPLIFVSSNVEREGKKMGVARTGGYWHSDTSFLEQPIPLTILYPQVVPQNSTRTTLFIDLQQALESLPDELRRRINGKKFVHSGKWKYKVRPEDTGKDLSEILDMIENVQPPVEHPAIIKHPVTGVESLFMSRGFTIGISGLPTDESDLLLEALLNHIEQPPFTTEFQWEPGDVIVWDNRFLAHKAGRKQSVNGSLDDEIQAEEATEVFRIIVRDGLPLTHIPQITA